MYRIHSQAERVILTAPQPDQPPEEPPKCFLCSAVFLDGNMALRDSGQWVHVRCARVLSSDERVRESLQRERRSQEKIDESQKPMAGGSAFPAFHEEPPAVVCVVCGRGIRSVADLAKTRSGLMHRGCRPPSR